MDNWKMANVIISGGSGFSFGHWNLSKGTLGRKTKMDDDKRQCNNKPNGQKYTDKDKTK